MKDINIRNNTLLFDGTVGTGIMVLSGGSYQEITIEDNHIENISTNGNFYGILSQVKLITTGNTIYSNNGINLQNDAISLGDYVQNNGSNTGYGINLASGKSCAIGSLVDGCNIGIKFSIKII